MHVADALALSISLIDINARGPVCLQVPTSSFLVFVLFYPNHA